VILKRLSVLVVLNRLVRVDALLVVGKQVFECWVISTIALKLPLLARPSRRVTCTRALSAISWSRSRSGLNNMSRQLTCLYFTTYLAIAYTVSRTDRMGNYLSSVIAPVARFEAGACEPGIHGDANESTAKHKEPQTDVDEENLEMEGPVDDDSYVLVLIDLHTHPVSPCPY
jgi:hypothetical protein